MIAENLKTVKENIRQACVRAGRDERAVTLVAVSKTKPVDMVMEAYDAGVRDFGENHVQELCMKYDEMPRDIRWHMIGHLQTNKVRQVVGKSYMIHSIDSLKLADCIEAESAKKGIVTEGLLEINVAGEDSKWGFAPEIDDEVLRHFSQYKNLRIRGLMTVAPDVDDPEENREVFRKLKALAVDIEAKNIDNISMSFLSMGMTGDYTVAVEEGAGFVRVGTGIFGSRKTIGD